MGTFEENYARALAATRHPEKKASLPQAPGLASDAFVLFRNKHEIKGGRVPDQGYAISDVQLGTYDSYYASRPIARRAAQLLATSRGRRIELIQIQNRGEDRFIINEFEPKRMQAANRPSPKEILGRSDPVIARMLTLPIVTIRRERLNSGGYTSLGQYFGRGEKLWSYQVDWLDKVKDGYVRAPTTTDAKRQVMEMHRNR